MKDGEQMTHDELVDAAAHWLSRNGHVVVITEMATEGEEADAIGFCRKESTLIECKTSRADFLADKKKWFRRNPEQGMGVYRYYLCERGLIKREELPPKWGLLEYDIYRKRPRVTKKYWPLLQERNVVAEQQLLISTIRRIGQSVPDGVSVKCYVIPTKNRARLFFREAEKR